VSEYKRKSVGQFAETDDLFKEVARGGERSRVLSIPFIFSFFTTLPLSHSGSPTDDLFINPIRQELKLGKAFLKLSKFSEKRFIVSE
jgi:hypothetical protein